MKILLALILSVLICHSLSQAEIVYVPQDYATIQNAIDSCATGDTILVAPANYQESLQINQKSFFLASYFLTDPDSSYISSTILTGDPSISISYTFDTVRVIGFSIEGGGSNQGAGMNISHSSVVVRDNHFKANNNGNWQTGQGGAIYALSSTLNLINNRFEYNESDYGGALYAIECQLQIRGNLFRYNRVQETGGALFIGQSTIIIEQNRFFQNWALRSAGAISCTGSQGIIHDNDIVENIYVELDSSGSQYGGGLFCSGSVFGKLQITNNRIEKNIADEGSAIYSGDRVIIQNNLIISNKDGLGAGIYINGDAQIINNTFYGNDGYSVIYCNSGSPQIINNIIWNNTLRNEWKTIHIIPSPGTPVISYCDIQDGYEGTGNISMDPFFRQADENDFHLKSTVCGDATDSPCIDAGSPAYSDSILNCQAGLGTALSDMGAYGGGKKIMTAIEANASPPKTPSVINIYPNPFNAQVTITYRIEKPQTVSISIYNLLGQKVATLVSEKKAAGAHQVDWDASGFASGVYYYRLIAGDFVSTKKLVLLK